MLNFGGVQSFNFQPKIIRLPEAAQFGTKQRHSKPLGIQTPCLE